MPTYKHEHIDRYILITKYGQYIMAVFVVDVVKGVFIFLIMGISIIFRRYCALDFF